MSNLTDPPKEHLFEDIDEEEQFEVLEGRESELLCFDANHCRVMHQDKDGTSRACGGLKTKCNRKGGSHRQVPEGKRQPPGHMRQMVPLRARMPTDSLVSSYVSQEEMARMRKSNTEMNRAAAAALSSPGLTKTKERFGTGGKENVFAPTIANLPDPSGGLFAGMEVKPSPVKETKPKTSIPTSDGNPGLQKMPIGPKALGRGKKSGGSQPEIAHNAADIIKNFNELNKANQDAIAKVCETNQAKKAQESF